jgi:isocitrate dehydrogenase
VITTFKGLRKEVVGCDVYLDATESAPALAAALEAQAAGTPFRLALISNRGTQVWPTGSVYTECVDYWRARFELRDGTPPGSVGQREVIALLGRVAERHTVCSYELLRTFDGARGFSLAQGQ